MCIAVAQEVGAKTLTHEELKNCWDSNPDGGGFAYIDDAGDIVVKRTMRFKEWEWEYTKAHKRYGKVSPFILHARIATHGSICMANTHPFHVETDVGEQVFAHNGILPVQTSKEDDLSDTRVFGDLYLNVLPDLWFDNPAIVDLVEDFTQGSKMVVLTTHPDAEASLYIINEADGNYSDDQLTWYSNYSWQKGWSYMGGATWLDDDEWGDWDYTAGTREKSVRPDAIAPKGGSGELYDDFFPNQSLHATLNVDDDTYNQFLRAASDSGYCPACFKRPCQCHWMCYNCMRHFDGCGCGPEFQEVPHLKAAAEAGLGRVINGNFGDSECDGSYSCSVPKSKCVCFEINLAASCETDEQRPKRRATIHDTKGDIA